MLAKIGDNYIQLISKTVIFN
uniref:Uncharacterized protein n=1 Tax=Rhizophora mucronata TaxID=61149 RepID=A0A2P2N2M1_RHIMU